MKYIVANWKMNMNAQEVFDWLNVFLKYFLEVDNKNIYRNVLQSKNKNLKGKNNSKIAETNLPIK